MSYAVKLLMHLNYGSKGSAMVRELIDFPGVTITDEYDKKNRKSTRTIVLHDIEYKTLDAAISEWKAIENKAESCP